MLPTGASSVTPGTGVGRGKRAAVLADDGEGR